jgi:hypothetical protein
MSKKNGDHKAPELPRALQGLLDRAKAQGVPKGADDDRKALPTIYELLLPVKIDDPNHKGEGKAKQVWREPLLMISFDRSLGLWKVAIGDKLFRLTTSTYSESLQFALSALEDAIVNKSAVVRERDS